MTDNWFENEREKLRNFGVSAPVSERIRQQLKLEAESRKFQQMLRRVSKRHFLTNEWECPKCHKPMKKKYSEIEYMGYLLCECFEKPLDALEYIYAIYKYQSKSN